MSLKKCRRYSERYELHPKDKGYGTINDHDKQSILPRARKGKVTIAHRTGDVEIQVPASPDQSFLVFALRWTTELSCHLSSVTDVNFPAANSAVLPRFCGVRYLRSVLFHGEPKFFQLKCHLSCRSECHDVAPG
ncbi:hypothetical protein J6590_070614 [Homalodisca vitripennis]|nr:hypothetical protein J6590_070614 [Homalodisca vitripennis]